MGISKLNQAPKKSNETFIIKGKKAEISVSKTNDSVFGFDNEEGVLGLISKENEIDKLIGG